MSVKSRLMGVMCAVITAGTIGATAVQADSAKAPAGPTTVSVASTVLGNAVVDANGRTLYVFFADPKGNSVCYGQCAVAWPPLLTNGQPIAANGAMQYLLGTITRRDGSTQVTYDGRPLYYWFRDSAAGDVKGQWVGNTWFVIGPNGGPNGKVVSYVGMAKSPIGDVLVGPNGRTLYMFDVDVKGQSKCYDKCAVNWPPLLTDVAPQANTGVDAKLLGWTKRTDGKMQVTYNGMPLYYWFNDHAANQWNGQAIGKVWWMVDPAGRRLATPLPKYAMLSSFNTIYGPILVGNNGHAVYMFAKDSNGQSVCYGGCAKIWPPVLSDIPIMAGAGVNAKLFGTVKRTDGTMQVTYNGMPLYYYAGDTAAGQLNGQNVFSVWFVLRPTGEVLKPG